MIYYFSSTGNSQYVAIRLAEMLGERTCDIYKKEKEATDAQSDETVIFVFPVHAWGPAKEMSYFIESEWVNKSNGKQSFYAVATCGDDCGNTDRLIDSLLYRYTGQHVTGVYSVTMPNTYVLMPGFDVDSDETARQKIDAAPERISAIAEAIQQKRPVPELYERGRHAWLKHYVVRPLFQCYLKFNFFRVKNDCISCGRCAGHCFFGIIKMQDGKPKWENKKGDMRCTQCLACYHRCPLHAIEFGSITRRKGQYLHPNLTKRTKK